MSGRKASTAEMYLRQQDIQACMAKGSTRAETAREVADKYRVSVRSIERQYDDMVVLMEKQVEAGRAELRAKLMSRNDDIYKKSMAAEEYKTALAANTEQAKLGGLLISQKSEGNEPPQIITIKEREYTGPELVKTGSSSE
jgi:hypothetical protein